MCRCFWPLYLHFFVWERLDWVDLTKNNPNPKPTVPVWPVWGATTQRSHVSHPRAYLVTSFKGLHECAKSGWNININSQYIDRYNSDINKAQCINLAQVFKCMKVLSIYFHQSVGIAAVQCAGNLFLAWRQMVEFSFSPGSSQMCSWSLPDLDVKHKTSVSSREPQSQLSLTCSCDQLESDQKLAQTRLSPVSLTL